MLNNTGPKREPCVTPMLTRCVIESVSFTLTLYFLLVRIKNCVSAEGTVAPLSCDLIGRGRSLAEKWAWKRIEDGSLWGTARAFRKKASPISALNGPNGIALSDSNKTDLIAQSLESQFQLNNIQNPQKDQIISSIVDAYINDHANTTDEIQPALPLNAFLENENILVPEQHGFRPRLSTSHQLLRVVEYIKDAFDRNQHVAAVFLDIQKAFDRVWHTGLLFKLITYKIPPPLILLLKSYISDRSFTVRINRTFSQTRPAKAGIAQGSILGPVLFNLYVNDIIKTTNTMICMYADDTAILSRHYDPNTLTQNINEHLAHLEIWFSVWKIAINTSKTEAISFSQKRPPPKSRSKTKRYPGLYTPNTLVSLLIKTSRSDNILHTPSKLTAKINENKLDVEDFKIPRKTAKSNTVPKENIKINSKNKFAALNTANDDVEDVTPAAPKVKPVMMKLFPEYNLILQEIHRTHPTATNTHIGGYIKIQAESSDHHREITQFLTDKGCQYYVTDPPANRPLKLVIKGLLATTEPEEIKKDLIDQGIKIEKIAQLRQFKTKSPLPIFMIEITRDENVDDIFKIRSCLYMQVKFDPFRKNSRPTQCYNCNFFHHASQNCSMKTRCLKCGGGHRTGQCEIKEKNN
ncbi:probable RNA-directed DNA polymerase from transposon BS [Trichonephila clavipes]|nr:probable RNA-directed DNA polymerase from transposon BS [Trichonephila clavipes]